MLFRCAMQDYQVSGTDIIIEKGQNILVPISAIHQDSRYFYDPMKFDPSRFSPEEVNKRPSMSFLPFGDGPRNCVGMRFGLIQTKLGIATMIRNFELKLHQNTSYPLLIDNGNMLISPLYPLKCLAKEIVK